MADITTSTTYTLAVGDRLRVTPSASAKCYVRPSVSIAGSTGVSTLVNKPGITVTFGPYPNAGTVTVDPEGGAVDVDAITAAAAASQLRPVYATESGALVDADQSPVSGGGDIKRARLFGLPPIVTTVMPTPPTVTINGASQIATRKVWRLLPPTLPTVCEIYDGTTPIARVEGYGGAAWGLFGTQSSNNTTVAAPAAAGATQVSLSASVSAGQYLTTPAFRAGMAPADFVGQYVTVQSVSGSGPYLATLSAPLSSSVFAGDRWITTATPGLGYTSGGGLVSGQGMTQGSGINVSVEFVTDAATVELLAQMPNGGLYRLSVDGQLATSAFQSVGTVPNGNNSGNVITVAFGSSALRRLKFEFNNLYPAAIYTAPSASVISPGAPKVRVGLFGDSYMGYVDGIHPQFCAALGWDWVAANGIGGTGWETTNASNLGGNPGNLAVRLAGICAAQTDVVGVLLGINDPNGGSATLTETVRSCLQYIKDNGKKDAFVFVVGPWSTGNNVNSTKSVTSAQIKAGCALVGVPYLDPISETWVTGTGKQGSEANNGNADLVINSDGTHPTTYGLAYNAARILAGLRGIAARL